MCFYSSKKIQFFSFFFEHIHILSFVFCQSFVDIHFHSLKSVRICQIIDITIEKHYHFSNDFEKIHENFRKWNSNSNVIRCFVFFNIQHILFCRLIVFNISTSTRILQSNKKKFTILNTNSNEFWCKKHYHYWIFIVMIAIFIHFFDKWSRFRSKFFFYDININWNHFIKQQFDLSRWISIVTIFVARNVISIEIFIVMNYNIHSFFL